jgi:hypothetical protein
MAYVRKQATLCTSLPLLLCSETHAKQDVEQKVSHSPAPTFARYTMYSTADYTVTLRPQYLADSHKMPDCYTYLMELHTKLEAKPGTFLLFDF